MTGAMRSLQTPGQLIIISLDGTGEVIGIPALPFRMYVGRGDSPGSELSETAELMIKNDTGVPIRVTFMQKFPNPGQTTTPIEAIPALDLPVGDIQSMRLRMKENYQTWFTPLRPSYRRHFMSYYLHVILRGLISKECSIYGDIDPEFIVEGRP